MILSFIQKVAGPCFHRNIMRLPSTTLPDSDILEKLNTNDTPNSDKLNATIDLAKAPQDLQGSPIAKVQEKAVMNMPHFRRIGTIRNDFLRGSLQSAIFKLPSEWAI
ncbi:hypothetical protein FCULG_00006009 [Fusarium culmorum]|uniref:Uncharacterized protein n=1 Tax=Fusarium culmorum TaxID=5516 RepID=A0A2T4GVW0_FUSCU|nr:hypothetical protein FCULG_00006009 [Fusarium culmorum]